MDVIKGEVYWGGLQNLGSTREVPGAGSRGATSTRQGLPLGHTGCQHPALKKVLCLAYCYTPAVLKCLIIFKQVLHFHFAWGPTNSVASPGAKKKSVSFCLRTRASS